ncbi:hypothetical protein BDF19DRAFT_414837 [Syncephalis fuscata]|nr:hypothetical protein BDF19DRAFT_414837 [Syncephalis fuscata]
MDSRGTGTVVHTSASSSNTGYISNSASPASLASRKNIRQPDITLDLERKVSRRRKTKDDFELDNAPSSSSTSTGSNATTSAVATGSNGHIATTSSTPVNSNGVGSSISTLSSSNESNTLPIHAQDDMITSCVGSSSSNSNTTTTGSNSVRSSIRSNTIDDREMTPRLTRNPSSNSQHSLETKPDIEDSTSSQKQGSINEHECGHKHGRKYESTGITSARHRGQNNGVLPPTINTQFLRRSPIMQPQTAGLVSTSTRSNSVMDMSATSANPLTATVNFAPNPLNINETEQMPTYRHPICPSPTYYALDFGGHGTPQSAFFQSGSATPRTPLAGGMLASPSAPTRPRHKSTLSNSSQTFSSFSFSPAHSPALSPAYNAFHSSQDLLAHAISASVAAREMLTRENGLQSNGSSPAMNDLKEKGKSVLAQVEPISMPPAMISIVNGQMNQVATNELNETALLVKTANACTQPTTVENDEAAFISSLAPIDRCPVEVMLVILSYLPNTSLHHCVQVSRRWHMLTSYALYRSPPLNTLAAFKRLVNTISNEESASKSSDDTNSTLAIALTRSNSNDNSDRKPNAYAQLVQRLDLASMDEQHRCAPDLSHQLTRAAPYLQGSLRELDLGFCKGARNYDLQRMAPLLANLTYLNLAGGGRTDIVISKIAKHCPRLLRLSVAWNAQVSDFGCAEIARNCPQLRSLDLTCCNGIADAGIASIIDGCTNLRILGVAYCNGVSNVTVRDAANRLPRLRWLSVNGCSGVSRACIRECDILYPGVVISQPGVLPLESDLS